MIDPLKQCCFDYVNSISVEHSIDAFLHILGDLQTYSLCGIWKSVIADMMRTIDVKTHISQYLQILGKLHECELHQSWMVTISNMKITQSITCQQILCDDAFSHLPGDIVHELIKIFRTEYQHLIHQHMLWTAVVSWAKAQSNNSVAAAKGAVVDIVVNERDSCCPHSSELSDSKHDDIDRDQVVEEDNPENIVVDIDKFRNDSKCDTGDYTAKQLIGEFVEYFDFTAMDPGFVRQYVEPQNVLDPEQRIVIYRTHSVQLSALQKRIHELEVENKRRLEAYQVSQRNLKHLRKEHKKEISQYERHFSANSMGSLYLHRHQGGSSMSPHVSPRNLRNDAAQTQKQQHISPMIYTLSRPSYPVLSPSSTIETAQSHSNHLSETNIRFTMYSREYLTVSKNGKQIETKRDDCHWLLSYFNVKCRDGVHIISIKAHECEHGYDAIGIVAIKDMAFIAGKHFPDDALGRQYYYHPKQHSWSRGEVVTMMVDCISSRITFKKNSTIVLKKEIEKSTTYYPVLQTCGCAGHRYEILEYKTIRSKH